MNRMRLLLFLFLFCTGFLKSYSSHIVGGYIRYDYLSNQDATSSNYEVTVVLYRDVVRANTAAIFTPTIPLSIFSQGTVSTVNLNLLSTRLIADSIEDPCFVRIDSLELEEGVYTGIINLLKSRDHLLVYQRCCRNNSIDNLIKPTDLWGNTWTIEVPRFNAIGLNSTPTYVNNPPLAFCPNQPLNLDLSATDIDGDSLAYSFCAPYTSPQNNPQPNPATFPPYSDIGFEAPQSAINPVPSSPNLTIDPITGILTGTPTAIGQYVVGFCIEEYRNGVLLSTSRRDIQINTANCSPVILTAVQDQTLLCDGRTVNFQNNTPNVPGYNIKGYRWDFGDPTTLADTSRSTNPSYTYSDTGLYTITLIANPGLRCSSITSKDFLVYDKLDPQIEVGGLLCRDSNSVTFIAGGSYENYATLSWNFGGSASTQLSSADTVRDIQFTGQQSSYTVNLTVQQDVCTEVRSRLVRLDPNPIASFSTDVKNICPPYPVNFSNRSIVNGQANYIWAFGDGDSAFVPDPTHAYEESGKYEVRLAVQTTENCIDTVIFSDSVFASRSFSTNEIKFGVEPKEGCSPLKVNFNDSSTYFGMGSYFWDLDNNNLSTDRQAVATYIDTGYYTIGLLLITSDTCADTLRLTLDSAIRVFPSPVADLIISEDTVSLKGALIQIDASKSEKYTTGNLFVDGKYRGSDEISTYRFRDTGRHSIDWVVMNELACSDTATSELFVFDEFEFEIPNVFTPNGDGVNDAFKVRACGVYEYKIAIFNRYGKKVYTSNSLSEGWNGYINEYKASPGVYYYQIIIKDLNGVFKNFEGSVSLLYE